MEANLTPIGVMIAVIVVLAEVIKALVSRIIVPKLNGKDQHTPKILSEKIIELCKVQQANGRTLHELLEMHKKTDDDGVPLWYFKRSLEKAIIDLGGAVNGLNQRVGELGKSSNIIIDQLSVLKKGVHEIVIRSRADGTGPRIRVDDLEP